MEKMDAMEKKMNQLFDELVPTDGKADTVAGEIVRAYSRIAYRYYNDGDMLRLGYSKETCNAAGRYLAEKVPAAKGLLDDMWGCVWGKEYEDDLLRVGEAILAQLKKHPELKTEKNEEDMWDYYDKNVDVDDEEDEYDEYDEDDEEDEW